jgi:hypothetical protein
MTSTQGREPGTLTSRMRRIVLANVDAATLTLKPSTPWLHGMRHCTTREGGLFFEKALFCDGRHIAAASAGPACVMAITLPWKKAAATGCGRKS